MRRTTFIPIALLALTACGSETPEEKSTDEVVAEARKMAGPMPGQYETTTVLREFSVPGVPAQQAEMMKQQFASGTDRTETFCLTKDQAEKGFEEMVRSMGQMGQGVTCSFSKFDASGSKLDAALNCTGPGGTTMTMGMDGTVESERSDMTMTMNSRSTMMPGMEMTMVMDSRSRRIGECPARSGQG
ncbi:DUF3617 domain-containing protein [Allopontixanthobacter sp.]|uniref:DUF3617 domain-containing protein n=1 Tax=Allopontixanthobacter sp. TaxID=2906452 RepID=UPI002ABBB233|nr:DUF3617 domain-containing protein [Allopontixanthobacter sp.]MDZ4308213.1 DUF3617 domain-containing protein [Allopontixanthobacter sp.]